jgi:hypothetical protein
MGPFRSKTLNSTIETKGYIRREDKKLNAKYFTPMRFSSGMRRFLQIALCATSLMMARSVAGQLPDAPQPAPQQEMIQRTPAPGGGDSDQKPLFTVIPDLGTASIDDQLPPQTVSEKMMVPTRNTLSVLAVVKPAFAAGFKEVTNRDPQLGKGPDGFGRYYWRTALDEVSENYLVDGVFPAVTHQDSRYYAMTEGGFWRRTGYALSRAFVIRNDAGNEVFNTSEILGAASAAGLANLYYPGPQTGPSVTAQRFGLDIGFDALTYAAKEFWPDVNRKVFRGKLQTGR